MKGTRNENTKQSKQQAFSNLPRPEIRDTLDSRKNLEQSYHGGTSTHHVKNVKSLKHKTPR
ncbi:hypothetical protein DVR12_03380 [Chitinophaga silvatica]|uniref:Uncharacterized protein n=1 Tax=Chitinophaga silvatica TaxID=2282649 RepID=A0A3E1YHH9_9BACT|nr:hypothetical protein [Chitinophaga silvatica]RFS26841.1 hypothetical protein DVR12_03380 [Chitinophaga silvatica]